LEISDLPLVFHPSDEFNFQMNQYQNRKLSEIIQLKFVFNWLIQWIKKAIDTMQPQRVILVVHNDQQPIFLC
jgi:hypothetical protein